MAADHPEGPLFVEGDYDAPAGTRLEEGVLATGRVHLGDHTVCQGDVFGAKGIELGDDVTINGNLYSHGEITWGNDLHLSGTIYSKAPRPLEEAMVRAGLAQESPPDLPMLQTAIQDTLRLLLEIAWDGHQEGLEGYPDSWWGLEWDETTEVVERLLDLIHQLHRNGPDPETWSADDLFDVLFKKAIAGVVPLTIERAGQGRAQLKVGRPDRTFDPEADLAGWPWPTVSLLNLIGYAANGRFRLVLNGNEHLLEADANPTSVQVTIELLETEPPAS